MYAKLHPALCLIGLLALPAPAQAQEAEKAMARVNGEEISRALYDAYTRQRYPQVAGEVHDSILQELINILLVEQQAQKTGLTGRPEVQAELQVMRSTFLTNKAIADHLANNPPKEAEIKAEYENHYANSLATEYHARHVLLRSDEEAMQVIELLDEGAELADLARERSIGPTAEKGGDLGWFLAEQMVPNFAAAVARLEPGQYTTKPVRTRFGWHVILLEDKRKVPPPPLEEVRSKLVSQLQSRIVEQYIGSLRKAAKIQTGTK